MSRFDVQSYAAQNVAASILSLERARGRHKNIQAAHRAAVDAATVVRDNALSAARADHATAYKYADSLGVPLTDAAYTDADRVFEKARYTADFQHGNKVDAAQKRLEVQTVAVDQAIDHYTKRLDAAVADASGLQRIGPNVGRSNAYFVKLASRGGHYANRVNQRFTAQINRYGGQLNSLRSVHEDLLEANRANPGAHDAAISQTVQQIASVQSQMIGAQQARRAAGRAAKNADSGGSSSIFESIGGIASAGAGAIGATTGAITALRFAAYGAALSARAFSENVNRSNHAMAAYNPTLATAFAHLSIRDINRSIQVSKGVEPSTLKLIGAIDKMRNSFVQFDTNTGIISNRFAFTASKFAGGAAGPLTEITNKFVNIQKALGIGEEGATSGFAAGLGNALTKAVEQVVLTMVGGGNPALALLWNMIPGGNKAAPGAVNPDLTPTDIAADEWTRQIAKNFGKGGPLRAKGFGNPPLPVGKW